MKIIKYTSWTKYLHPKKKLIQMRLIWRNGTVSTNKIEGFKERIAIYND
jgi:hypothetical protein